MQNHGTTSANLGQFAEINSAICRALPKAVGNLDPKAVISACQNGEALEQYLYVMFCLMLGNHKLEWSKVDFAQAEHIIPFKRDKRMEGWKLVRDCGRNRNLTVETISNLTHIPFSKKSDGDGISGEELVIRAGDLKASWSQRDAEFLLDNQHLIPGALHGKQLIFAGTIWQIRDYARLVAYLHHHTGSWHLIFTYLKNRYCNDDFVLPGLSE